MIGSIASSKHDVANAFCRDAGILVLPNPHYGPAGLGQPAIGVAVSRAVRLDFSGPKFGVCHCDGVVIRTPMPKAPVQKDRHLMAGKGEVSGAPDVLEGTY